MRDYYPVTVEAPCAAPPAHVFAVIVPIDLPLIFTGWGPLPGVRGVRDQTGPWDTPGRTRRVELTDGSVTTERLTEHTPPHSFAYELTGVLAPLVHRVRGEWTFTPDGTGTVVRWTYAFFPRRGRRLLVRLAVLPLWRRYATATLARAVDRCTDTVRS
jgi:Polyketide cyclase / dehydrase and lipid transport